jgi:hypothetical protein
MSSRSCFAILGIAAAMLVLVPQRAVAAGAATQGTVTTLTVQNSGGTNGQGVAFIYISSAHTGAPGCHTTGNRWVVDLGVESGRQLYALALSAYLSGRSLSDMVGTGTCSIWPDTESLLRTNTP